MILKGLKGGYWERNSLKTYTFEIVIKEGSDEFWESLKGTGCDEIKKAVEDTLEESGFVHTVVKLKKFEDEEK
jgi:hypothetical protein